MTIKRSRRVTFLEQEISAVYEAPPLLEKEDDDSEDLFYKPADFARFRAAFEIEQARQARMERIERLNQMTQQARIELHKRQQVKIDSLHYLSNLAADTDRCIPSSIRTALIKDPQDVPSYLKTPSKGKKSNASGCALMA